MKLSLFLLDFNLFRIKYHQWFLFAIKVGLKAMIQKKENFIPIEWLVRDASDTYYNCGDPDFKGFRKVHIFEKLKNEREIKKLSERLIHELETFRGKDPESLTASETEELKKAITSYILELDNRKLFFDKPFLGFFLEKGYMESAEDFLDEVKLEDSDLKPEEVFQAIRNVWIMNSLQLFWGIPLRMTPSVYAYSMLYPYTDNFLDSSEVSKEDKARFNERLTRVINGERVESSDPHEERVFELIGKIGTEFHRDSYPSVYESIGLIQKAQIESMKQDQKKTMAADEIIPISLFKGGASVLADAFLVKGELDQEETRFAFGYGSFLQLLDDLQDAESDRKEGHQTIFSMDDSSIDFDGRLRRLISFIFRVNEQVADDDETKVLMKDVIRTCTLMMVMEVVGREPGFVSRGFYRELESYSKVRLPFFMEYEKQMEKMIETLGIGSNFSQLMK
jgi:hypothetical protein